jgi:hypothetical protein
MDIKKLESSVRIRFNHHQSRLLMEEKYSAQLIIVNQDGTWLVTPELILYLKLASKTTILLDYYKVPVKINSNELLKLAQTTYDEVMLAWYTEYQSLTSKR